MAGGSGKFLNFFCRHDSTDLHASVSAEKVAQTSYRHFRVGNLAKLHASGLAKSTTVASQIITPEVLLYFELIRCGVLYYAVILHPE